MFSKIMNSNSDVAEDGYHEPENTADHRGLFDVLYHYSMCLSVHSWLK